MWKIDFSFEEHKEIYIKNFLKNYRRVIEGEKFFFGHSFKVFYNENMINLITWWFRETKKTDGKVRKIVKLFSWSIQQISKFSLLFLKHDISVKEASKLFDGLSKKIEEIYKRG